MLKSIWKRYARRHISQIYQVEKADCGVACVAMVARFYGEKLPLSHYRQLSNNSDRGQTLGDLMRLAIKVGFECKPYKISNFQSSINLPCILHWAHNHYVVLCGIHDAKYYINDPAEGERILSEGEFHEKFTGFALSIKPSPHFVPKTMAKENFVLRNLLSSKKNRMGLLSVVVLSLTVQALTMAAPLYFQYSIDSIPEKNSRYISILLFGFVGLHLGITLLFVVRQYIILQLAKALHLKAAEITFVGMLNAPFRFFLNRDVGDVVSRFGSLKEIRDLLSSNFVVAVVDATILIGALGFMLYYNATLSVLVVFVVLLYLLYRIQSYPRQRRLLQLEIIANAKHNSNIVETIQSIKTVKALGLESIRYYSWRDKFSNELNKYQDKNKYDLNQGSIRDFLVGAIRILAVYSLCQSAIHETITVGVIFTYLIYLDRFLGCSISVIDRAFELKMLGLHADRVSDIVDLSKAGSSSLAAFETTNEEFKSLSVRELSYSYPGSNVPTFENVNFDVNQGEAVAIVGPSGCGKTTLLLTIIGLIDPTSGKICINDEPISSAELKGRRGFFATVLQEDCLFDGSILENIAAFDPHPDIELVEDCARLACIYEDVDKMPMRFRTPISYLGSGLSGGQKQRVMLARALYRKPKVLVLDESTSNIDIETEKRINLNLKTIAVTKLIVAHRPDTINSADRVISLALDDEAVKSRTLAVL